MLGFNYAFMYSKRPLLLTLPDPYSLMPEVENSGDEVAHWMLEDHADVFYWNE